MIAGGRVWPCQIVSQGKNIAFYEPIEARIGCADAPKEAEPGLT